ncbi:MAG: 4-(cytidine 5'-diphospho)-2-C-methyl-D-erythritol kinase [Lachnospiraceae bacterium]|nr:4-(cytidine 5'-diphospho)-2-C-methyl-D-erythritol kinase [Lachnospiraceae bacterium]
MDIITLKAYAKINLALDVIGRRPNGYHDVRMIMQTIQLYDKVTMKRTSTPGIMMKTNLHYLPTNENNLVYAAAKLFKDTLHIEDGVYINLEKKIPVAAGMAGGSSDAAATLFGLNELFDTNLSLEQLMELGVQIGADVPFCLLRGTALSEGIGEILTPLAPAPSCYCLIVKPPVSVSTKFVYENLVLDETTNHPDIDGMLEAIAFNDLKGVTSRLGNVLEPVTLAECPEIAQIKQEMLDLGAIGSLMSGSGPTVFGLFDNQKKAEKAFYQFKIGEYGKQTFLTRFFNNNTAHSHQDLEFDEEF